MPPKSKPKSKPYINPKALNAIKATIAFVSERTGVKADLPKDIIIESYTLSSNSFCSLSLQLNTEALDKYMGRLYRSIYGWRSKLIPGRQEKMRKYQDSIHAAVKRTVQSWVVNELSAAKVLPLKNKNAKLQVSYVGFRGNEIDIQLDEVILVPLNHEA